MEIILLEQIPSYGKCSRKHSQGRSLYGGLRKILYANKRNLGYSRNIDGHFTLNFFKILNNNGVDFYTGVPDSLLKEFVFVLMIKPLKNIS